MSHDYGHRRRLQIAKNKIDNLKLYMSLLIVFTLLFSFSLINHIYGKESLDNLDCTIFVSSFNGSDTNDGTEEYPFKTLKTAILVL